LDGAILDELRGRYGIDTVAYLTAALVAEAKVWEIINGRGGTLREFLPVLLGRGLVASPSVTRELCRLIELGSDERALRRAGEALARRHSGEIAAPEHEDVTRRTR